STTQRPIGCWRLNLNPSGRCRRTCHNMPSGKVMSRLSARARSTVSFLSLLGGNHPSTMLRMVPLPIWRWGGKLIVRRRVIGSLAAAARMLGRRRRGGRELGGRQPPPSAAVGRVELLDPLDRIFLEGERAVVVEIQLREVPLPGSEIFRGCNLAVLVVVVAAEALFFAAPGRGFGRLERRRRREQRRGTRGRRRGKRG